MITSEGLELETVVRIEECACWDHDHLQIFAALHSPVRLLETAFDSN